MSEAAPAHVVMLVANDVATDTRVKKEALALAQSGLRVTVVGCGSMDRSQDSWMGPVRIVRVPVEFVIQEDEAARVLSRPIRRPLHDGGALARIKARERDVRGRSGLALQRREGGLLGTLRFKAGVGERQVERQVLRGRRFAVRVEGGLARRVDRVLVGRHVHVLKLLGVHL